MRIAGSENLAKSWRMSCKPRMRCACAALTVSRCVDYSVCFLPLKMYTGTLQKSLSLSIRVRLCLTFEAKISVFKRG